MPYRRAWRFSPFASVQILFLSLAATLKCPSLLSIDFWRPWPPVYFSSKLPMARRVLTSTSLPTKLFRQDQHPSQIYTQNFCISEVPPKKQKYIPKSGTYPNGFKVGSTNVGIKDNGEPDLVLVSSSELSNGAAVFTKNQFPAPSITVSKEALSRRGGRGLRGVIANSGCANLFTGQKGLEDARSMGRAAGETSEGEMMVMHTGGIRTK